MTAKPLVVLTDGFLEAELERGVLGDIADVTAIGAKNEMDLLSRHPDAAVLLVYHTIQWSERCMDGLKNCRAIIRCGVGYDNIAIRAAGERGIVACNVPDYGTEEVADHAMMLLLAIARRLVHADRAVRSGEWDPGIIAGAPRLRGRTLGILGCGRIGTAMARRAQAFGMRVVFYDPYQPPGYEKALGLERAYVLEEMLRQAEFLSVHCPLTPETRGILNERTLALLPRGAYVVNTARGPCIQGEALLQALDAGQVSYAGLDVVEKEPLEVEAIRAHPRIVLTPHAAFYSVEANEEMRRKSAEEARRVLLDQEPRNAVNLAYLKTPRCRVPAART